MPRENAPEANEIAPPSLREALLFWFKLGWISFGGPAGQIAIINRELVERRRWFSSSHFLNALNFCMLLPGPEAFQLTTYLGWRLHGVLGGVTAGALFLAPSVGILFALSWIYMVGGDVPWIAAIFSGLMPVVVALIADAVLRLGGKAVKGWVPLALAIGAFVLIHVFGVSFVLIVAGAGLIGGCWQRWLAVDLESENGVGEEGLCARLRSVPMPTWRRTFRVLVVGLSLWWLPVFSVASWLGWPSTAVQQGLFFSQAALVTFGGAYAVLPFVAQQAVESFHWLSHPQMMAGLAMAETTPGPLIMVLQFVGFVGGWQHPGGLSPMASASVCALLTTWVTFLPSVLFVLLAGPFVERISAMPRVSGALAAITAAVVGVIVSLGVEFTSHALWVNGRFDVLAAGVAVGAFVVLRFLRVGVIPVLLGGAVLGLLRLWW